MLSIKIKFSAWENSALYNSSRRTIDTMAKPKFSLGRQNLKKKTTKEKKLYIDIYNL